MKGNRRCRKFAEHHCGIATQLDRIRQQNHLYFFPLLMQAARGDESVTSVVAFAAKDHDTTHFPVMRQNIVSHRSTSIFHERERWHAEALAGGAVNGSHF